MIEITHTRLCTSVSQHENPLHDLSAFESSHFESAHMMITKGKTGFRDHIFTKRKK